MIKIENLKKSFGEQIVLDGVNLEIEQGKITVIIGKSGTGKSVLLKNIIGLLKPDEGKIFYNEEDIISMNKKRLNTIRMRFGVLFQDAALFDSLNVFENIAFPVVEHRLIKSRKKIVESVKNTLKLVGLGEIYGKMPSELSGGMRKRVGLARAIITQPEIVFFDEPTTGLDPVSSMGIANLIKNMQEHLATTCFIISHDLSLTFAIADNIGLLDNGRIVEFGKKESFLNSNNELVKDFLKAYKIGEKI
jgi:phospholipid/cholesterol/gamma-HCH transport system ATP-binding protein